MGDRYGSALYPKEFVESLPKADATETRPLLILLRGEHADADAEIERIERWFRELHGPADRKATLAGNLRSLKPRHFWSALSELMTSRVLAERNCVATFEAPVAGLTPDFLVRCLGDHEFVVEVLTAFEEEEYRRQNVDLYYVANALAEVRHRIAVFIDEVDLPATRPSLKPLVSRVSAWLDMCRPDEPAKLCLSPDEVGLSVTLSTVGLRLEPVPIVEGIVGPGGKISTHETIRDALRGKSSKYRVVKDAGLPLLLCVWEGTWLHVNPTSLEWALFGQDRVTFTRTREGIKSASWGRAPGGLFGFGADGDASRRTSSQGSRAGSGSRAPGRSGNPTMQDDAASLAASWKLTRRVEGSFRPLKHSGTNRGTPGQDTGTWCPTVVCPGGHESPWDSGTGHPSSIGVSLCPTHD